MLPTSINKPQANHTDITILYICIYIQTNPLNAPWTSIPVETRTTGLTKVTTPELHSLALEAIAQVKVDFPLAKMVYTNSSLNPTSDRTEAGIFIPFPHNYHHQSIRLCLHSWYWLDVSLPPSTWPAKNSTNQVSSSLQILWMPAKRSLTQMPDSPWPSRSRSLYLPDTEHILTQSSYRAHPT